MLVRAMRGGLATFREVVFWGVADCLEVCRWFLVSLGRRIFNHKGHKGHKERIAKTEPLRIIEIIYKPKMNTINIKALERELLELDAAFLDAVLKNDVTVIERDLPDDFLSVFPDGRVASKAAEIENVRTVEL